MSKVPVTRTTQDRYADIFMGVVLVITILAIIGWVFNKLILASFKPAYLPMAPGTALIFLGLWCTWFIRRIFNAWNGMRIVIPVIQMGIMIIVLLMAFRALTGLGPDLEKLIYPNPPLLGQIATGHMSPLVALGFILAIPALVLLTRREQTQQVKSIAAGISLVVFTLSGIILLGYLYRAPVFYGGTTIPVALTTALSFMFLSLGLMMMAGPTCWPLRMYSGHSIKARLMRAFIPASIIIALLQGLLEEVSGPWVINLALRVAIAALAATLIVIIIISLI